MFPILLSEKMRLFDYLFGGLLEVRTRKGYNYHIPLNILRENLGNKKFKTLLKNKIPISFLGVDIYTDLSRFGRKHGPKKMFNWDTASIKSIRRYLRRKDLTKKNVMRLLRKRGYKYTNKLFDLFYGKIGTDQYFKPPNVKKFKDDGIDEIFIDF